MNIVTIKTQEYDALKAAKARLEALLNIRKPFLRAKRARLEDLVGMLATVKIQGRHPDEPLCPRLTVSEKQRIFKLFNPKNDLPRLLRYTEIPDFLTLSLLSAWRRQVPRRTPGKSVRMLLTVLSKPSVRIPRTRYDGSC